MSEHGIKKDENTIIAAMLPQFRLLTFYQVERRMLNVEEHYIVDGGNLMNVRRPAFHFVCLFMPRPYPSFMQRSTCNLQLATWNLQLVSCVGKAEGVCDSRLH